MKHFRFSLLILCCFFVATALAKTKIEPKQNLSGHYEFHRNGLDMGSVDLLKTTDDKYEIYGMAYWYGTNWKDGNVNMGSMCGIAKQDGDSLVYTNKDGVCQLNIKPDLHKNALMITDNGQCGGHNVSFSGLYLKTSATQAELEAQKTMACD